MQITVPTNLGANPLKIIIGGVEYALGAGETIDVPAEVVAEMNRMQASMVHPDMPVDIPFKDAEQEADIQANKEEAAALDAKTDPYIVTLTPTALDFSGTMDKTVAEIYAAYQAGKKIVFRLATAADAHIDVDVTLVGTDGDYDYPSFEGYVIQPATNLFIWAGTEVTDDGTKDTYSTAIFALTPAT